MLRFVKPERRNTTISALSPFHLLDNPEEIIPVCVTYKKGLLGQKVPIQPPRAIFRPVYLNVHQSASEVFTRSFGSPSSSKFSKGRVEDALLNGSNDSADLPGSTAEKPKRQNKKHQNKIVLKLNCHRSSSNIGGSPASDKPKRKYPKKPVTSLTKLETNAHLSDVKHAKKGKSKSSDSTIVITESANNSIGNLRLSQSTPKKKKPFSELKKTESASFDAGFGCWTCRIRHKSCPQDAERCSTCVRLGLFCDRSPQRPKYMVNKDICKRVKRDIKEITDSSRHRSSKLQYAIKTNPEGDERKITQKKRAEPLSMKSKKRRKKEEAPIKLDAKLEEG